MGSETKSSVRSLHCGSTEQPINVYYILCKNFRYGNRACGNLDNVNNIISRDCAAITFYMKVIIIEGIIFL